MSQFRGMIHVLVGEAREELFETLIVVRMSADREAGANPLGQDGRSAVRVPSCVVVFGQ